MKTPILQQQSVHNGHLILVNQRFPFVEHAGDHFLVPVGHEDERVRLERRAAYFLSQLMDKLGGWRDITPVSGWRSLEEQQDLYARSLRENVAAFTKQFVALPGHSEHQTGLAIDLGLAQPDLDFIRPEFPYAGICQEFRAQAAAYGFVERYPRGKEDVTGIAHEPWHFRYVGRPHAEIMTDKGFVLEEYHDFLKQFPFGETPFSWRSGEREYAVAYLEVGRSAEVSLPSAADTLWSVSGDNEAGFIVTTWREETV